MADAIVLGAGPAGLAAALTLVSSGTEVTLIDGADQVGGLCTTRRRNGLSYDVGGHILFVRDDVRRAWLEQLLGDDLRWVDRPVACLRDGQVARGRYLDQAISEPGRETSAVSGAQYLEASVGSRARDREMRGYLEKIDGMPLESIPAARVAKLLHGQSAPDGFWYPRRGIGQLMDAMAKAFVARGGTLRLGQPAREIRADAGGVRVCAGHSELRAMRLICAIPATWAAKLACAPPNVRYQPAMRAVAIVYLLVDRPPNTEQAWIQVDAPEIPFARLAVVNNWSGALVPPGQTLAACEVYCRATPDDRWWTLSDYALAEACSNALSGPLALTMGPARPRLVEVVRLPHAYPSVPVDQVPQAMAVSLWLSAQPNLTLAQGGAVIEAIDAGEAAASSHL